MGSKKPKQWRAKSQRLLNTRPIYEREFPKLAKAMVDDGVTLYLTDNGNGYEWYVADYQVPAKSVREVWGLTPFQMRRFTEWALIATSELVKWE